MSTYYAGTVVELEATFYDVNLNPIDPTGVSVEVEYQPGGVKTTYSYPGAGWTHVTGSGSYVYAIDTTGWEGKVLVVWHGTGAAQAVGVGSFDVVKLPIS